MAAETKAPTAGDNRAVVSIGSNGVNFGGGEGNAGCGTTGAGATEAGVCVPGTGFGNGGNCTPKVGAGIAGGCGVASVGMDKVGGGIAEVGEGETGVSNGVGTKGNKGSGFISENSLSACVSAVSLGETLCNSAFFGSREAGS